MFKLNCLNYKYNNQYYFQQNHNKSIKIPDYDFIENLKKQEYFSEISLIDILSKHNYSKDEIKFLTDNNILIKKTNYKETILNILENLLHSIYYKDNTTLINSIFIYSKFYGYNLIHVIKAAIELDRHFIIERCSKNDMKIKFSNGYTYDINTEYDVFNQNVIGCTITRSKSLTSYLLSTHNIKVPRQKLFYTSDLSPLKDFIKEIKYPICLKPDNMCECIDVFPLIENELELDIILNYYRPLYDKFVVEKTIIGNTYRLYYCYGTIIGAIQKHTRFIIGDGVNSIYTLIINKYNSTTLETLNKESYFMLNKLQLNEDDVLPLGRKIYISNTGTTDNGFVYFNVENLDPYYSELALNISRAIGLDIFAVDLIAKSLTNVDEELPTIVEVQDNPSFSKNNLIVDIYYLNIIKNLVP